MFLVDPREGASGDTILGALFAASGINRREMEEILSTAGSVMSETRVRLVEDVERGTRAIRVEVEWEGGESEIPALKMKKYLVDALEAVSIPRDDRFAREAFERIVRAEEEFHREPLGYLHLHETGTPDTIVDIVGVAYLRRVLEMEGEWVEGLPPGVGRGNIVIAHGIFKVPAPATRIILRGMPYRPGPWEGELLTPTGAAILKGLVEIWRKVDDSPDGIKFLGAGVGNRVFQKKRTLLRLYGRE